MQIHSLRTFYWVTRLNSFRRAAEVLNISQPTVSSRIRGLEEELGTALLHRDRDLALTEQGRELLAYAQNVLRLTEDLSFYKANQPVETRLRMGANGPVAATWLMPLVQALEKTFPDLRLEIEVNQTSTLADHIAANQLELAFVSGELTNPALRIQKLGAYNMVWAAKPGMAPSSLTDEELSRLPIVGYRWPSPVHPFTHLPASRANRHHRFTQSDSLFMMIRLAIEGVGLILVPRAAIRRELEAGLLCIIEAQTNPLPLPVLIARPRAHDSEVTSKAVLLAQKLMDEVVE